MRLLGGNIAARISGIDELPGKSSYFIGNDPKRWHTNIPSYAKVKYSNVYPGVDLVYYGKQGQLEYDFVVRPGAEPRHILMRVGEGMAGSGGGPPLSLDEKGNLLIGTADGTVTFGRPVVYQPRDSGAQIRDFVNGRYVISSSDHLSFEIARYDKSRPLVIDPTLAYSTYLNMSGNANAIAVDGSGMLTLSVVSVTLWL